MNLEKKHNLLDEIQTIDLVEIAKVLWIHKWIIIAIMLIFFVFTGIWSIFKLPIYQTTALMQVSNSNISNSLSSMFGKESALGGLGGSQSASSSDVEMMLMQSAYILKPTIRQLNLDASIQPKYFPLLGSYFANHYKGAGVAPAKLGLSSYAWGGESWSLGYFVTPESLYKEKFKLVAGDQGAYKLFSPNGDLVLQGKVGRAAKSTDGTVRILLNHLTARPGEVFYLRKYSLVGTLTGLSNSLNIAELAPPHSGAGNTGIIQLSITSAYPGAASQVLNIILNLTAKDSKNQKALSSATTLAFIKTQVPKAQKRLEQSEARFAKQVSKTGILDAQGQATAILAQMTQLDQQLGAAKAIQAQYRQSYTDANPVMQGLNAQVASLEQHRNGLKKQIAYLPMHERQGVELMQDVEVQKAMYMALLTSEQQYELANAASVGDVRILNYAAVPDQSLPSKVWSHLLASLLGGFILGSLIVFLRHQFRNFIFDPYWAEKEFGIPTVAVLPYSQNQVDAKKAFDEGEKSSIHILAVTKPEDPCVEAVRSLRTSLFFALKEKETNVLNITGAVPATGKSFISVNLAVVMAQMNKRVVLIDADMRRGYLNRYFKKSHAPGLSEVLNDVKPLEKVIHQTAVPGLDFIAAGMYPDNPSELLLKDDFKQLVEHLSKNYDVVIIDSPPILAVNDASVIAKASPVNYLVIPAGQLKGKEIETAVKRFYNDGVTITGTLFNFMKKGAERISSHTYQNKYTSYYQKDTEQQNKA